MSRPYGHRIILHDNTTGEVVSYCVTGHNHMTESISELKEHLKLVDPKKHTFHCIGYACSHNYDKIVEATWEWVTVEDYDSLP